MEITEQATSRWRKHVRLPQDADPEDHRITDGDPLSGECLQTAELSRRATSGARRIAVAALGLAVASCLCTAVLLHRMEAGAVNGAPEQSVGLSLLAETDAEDAPMPRYYRVFLNTIVREDRDLRSSRVGVLNAGDQVLAVERQGRRVRIEQPLRGWMSMTSADGLRILRPDGAVPGVAEAPAADANASGFARVVQGREAAALAESLRQRTEIFAELEEELLKAMRQLNEAVALGPGTVVGGVISAKQVQSAGKAALHGAVQFAVGAAEAVHSGKQAAEKLVQQKLSPQVREQLAQSLDPQKLLGDEGDRVVSVWTEALSK